MTTLPIAEARANFSKLVDLASTTHERIDVTRNGRRVAVLLGADDYDSLMETMEILSDPELVAGIAEGQRDIDEGRVYTSEQMREAMRAAGREV
jgi:prevent-host-death family protein